MQTTFDLLADGTRRRILVELTGTDRSVGELVERLGMSQPAISKQLRILRDACLATARKDGQRRIYRLEPEGLREIDEWLAPFRAAWERRLDTLEEVLASMEE